MKEQLSCPECRHSLSSSRTTLLPDTRKVGCKRCGSHNSLGVWRASNSSLDEFESTPPNPATLAPRDPVADAIAGSSRNAESENPEAKKASSAVKVSKKKLEPKSKNVLTGCLLVGVATVLLCCGCPLMIGDSGGSRYDSVDRDIDKFDRHFPNASEEERRLTRELYEQDSQRRGY
ncbi:hypothetical protein [Rosistilla oblonga]|uniref:Zinc finger/thioredoxin putative domain-containing protein n=1 Tax=Rosistilla oblonga TaxID=2527990 RepID=A0A518INE9_9BACT|nr:hypothetical protein [Rosistilla oblonga]QDV54610.1 hypothetical protein Mal33_05650 [Rosistilla oblonga]